jgi:branched-chain amino acid transport system permease protein
MTMSTKLETIARRVWVPGALALLLWLAYLIAQYGLSDQYERIALNMFVLVVLVIGLQIFSGNSGVLSFGHVAFMAIGAYVSALLTIPAGLKQATFTEMPGFLDWILDVEMGSVTSTLVAGVCAAVFALIAAAPIVRLSGVPAGIATLALLVIVYTFNIQTASITRGTSTMIGVPATTTITSALVWAMLAVVVAYVYQASRRGVRLRASRENPGAARSVGVTIPIERGVAWVLSAFVMGVGGALYAHNIVAFSAGEFYFATTFVLVLMLVVGGMTSVSGAVVGVIFISVLQEVLRDIESGPLGGDLPGFAQLMLAVVLLSVLVWRSRGLTAGHEIPWPGDWRLPRRLSRRGGGGAGGGAAAAPGGGEQSIGDVSSHASAGPRSESAGDPAPRS